MFLTDSTIYRNTETEFPKKTTKDSIGQFYQLKENEMLEEHEQALAEWESEQSQRSFFSKWVPGYDFVTSCRKGNRSNDVDESPVLDDGVAELHVDRSDAKPQIIPESLTPKKEHKLGELFATAICGNDITSSCLYVIGVCISYAGIWAPICLLLVSVLLFLFRVCFFIIILILNMENCNMTLLEL